MIKIGTLLSLGYDESRILPYEELPSSFSTSQILAGTSRLEAVWAAARRFECSLLDWIGADCRTDLVRDQACLGTPKYFIALMKECTGA
jgi:hypothetical protein